MKWKSYNAIGNGERILKNWRVGGEDGLPVCTVHESRGKSISDLIASAPDLLEACIEAHQQAEAGEPLGIGTIELLLKAISKAKGGN